ncbi:MAG: hypothetical protein ACOX6T_09945 [Myxococcales bacterium]
MPLSLLFLAGSAGAQAGALPLEVSVEVTSRSVVPYVPAEVVITIRNRLDEPVAIVGLRGASGEEAFLEESFEQRFPATLSSGKARVSGTMLVENPGTQARLPAPPRWQWSGEEELVTFPVLLPGRKLVTKATLRPTELTQFAQVQVRYAFISREQLLRVVRARCEPASAADAGAGYQAAERLFAEFTVKAPFGPAPERPLTWRGRAAQAGDGLPVGYPCGLSRAQFERLEANVSETRRALPLRLPAIGLSDARARAKVAQGRYAYASFPGVEAWVLEKSGDTVLVGSSEIEVLPGQLIDVLLALNASESVEIELFASEKQEDPGELVGFLRSRRFDATSSQQKGGLWRGTLRIKRSELRSVCGALKEKGARIEGLSVVVR